MTPRELRKAMRERRKELRRALKPLRKRAREQAERNPVVRDEKERRRRRRMLVEAIVLLLLALLLRCQCQPPLPPKAPPKPKVEIEVPKEKPKPPAKPKAKKPPIRAKADTQPRAGYLGASRAAPGWLDDFRLQVAARSGRLAQCFTGNDRPGTLRWTTSVNPENGSVSQHEIEAVGNGAELQGKQRECVVKVLSNPAYKLGEESKRGLPDRISLVIEF
jgi:hypothetical protein